MSTSTLNAISPVDGRYYSKTKDLAQFFSEAALIKYRVKVEIEYFIALCELPLPQLEDVDPNLFRELRNLYVNFSIEDAEKVKEIEKVTNHDVKAVEYFIKSKMEDAKWGVKKEFIHFGLTSQDINNTAVPMSLRDCMLDQYIPCILKLVDHLSSLAEEWKIFPC